MLRGLTVGYTRSVNNIRINRTARGDRENLLARHLAPHVSAVKVMTHTTQAIFRCHRHALPLTKRLTNDMSKADIAALLVFKERAMRII